MKRKKIKNIRDLLRDCDPRFLFKNTEEGNLRLRSIVAQILWLILIYEVTISLIPIKEWLISNSIMVILLGFFNLISSVIPETIKDLISGKFFQDCEMNFLNKSIFFMFIAIPLTFLLKDVVYQYFEKHGNKQ